MSYKFSITNSVIWNIKISQTKTSFIGTSLVVQQLRLCAPNAGGPGSIPGQGTRSHMLQLKVLHATTKDPTYQLKNLHAATKDPAYCN